MNRNSSPWKCHHISQLLFSQEPHLSIVIARPKPGAPWRVTPAQEKLHEANVALHRLEIPCSIHTPFQHISTSAFSKVPRPWLLDKKQQKIQKAKYDKSITSTPDVWGFKCKWSSAIVLQALAARKSKFRTEAANHSPQRVLYNETLQSNLLLIYVM